MIDFNTLPLIEYEFSNGRHKVTIGDDNGNIVSAETSAAAIAVLEQKQQKSPLFKEGFVALSCRPGGH